MLLQNGHRISALLTFLLLVAHSYAASNSVGLAVTFGAGGQSHTTSSSNIALHVTQGEAASPFIPAGPFTAVWEGYIHAELRGEFYFQGDLNGSLKLEVVTNRVMDGSVNGTTPLSKAISLSKGANKLKLTYSSPQKGDAYLRLYWTEKGTNTSPIPPTVLSHSQPDHSLEFGRELFVEHRCNKCHVEVKGTLPELAMDAPSFEGIGSRRNSEWMARWILNPKAERASARMPKLPKDANEANAMAAFLASLKADPVATRASARSHVVPPDGKRLYDALLCGTCHTDKDIPLKHVAAKFPPGKLVEYLLAPEAHFAWTRMPNFKLSEKEAETLAKELLEGQPRPETAGEPGEALIKTGRTLVQSRGCLNCHSLRMENQFTAPKLGDDWNKGCVAASPNAPHFGFGNREREALIAFGRTDRSSLTRHVPSEFAERQMRLLNCRACHGQQEGFPPVDILGGKLRPQWSAKFISGDISYKPRAETHPRGEPWLLARMPAFKAWGEFLGFGMAALHGYPPQSPIEKPDPELARHGQKLVGKDGGFSCVSCHGVGPVQATDVFDSEGINLAWSAERLLPDYYRRWVRNPLSIDPQTKMPVYFDEEGRSPLTEILDGDGEKQITAMWHYLLMGEKMPRPNLGETQ